MASNKIIDITKRLENQTAPWIQHGIDVLNSLDSKDASAAVQFTLNYVFKEVEIGLGLIDLDSDMGDTQIADKIAQIYEEAAAGCYFCSNGIDPNEDEFGPETKLCLKCKLKLANFTQALGIPAGKVFKGLNARAQKARIMIK
jgi:hypothetical protein